MMGSNPNDIFNEMYANNPKFREFADSMKGKDPREAFREKGFDFDQIRKMMQ